MPSLTFKIRFHLIWQSNRTYCLIHTLTYLNVCPAKFNGAYSPMKYVRIALRSYTGARGSTATSIALPDFLSPARWEWGQSMALMSLCPLMGFFFVLLGKIRNKSEDMTEHWEAYSTLGSQPSPNPPASHILICQWDWGQDYTTGWI